ncbi:response regulator transcription factor [Elizabethkingia sp. JS20170427COW]|uniref:response regulator transcription factor n=1 Tax=Elizabethkingia sp. JS20170427COW TaxID=2583851 RepID=UPI0011108045|nr:response regulator [Elizabethkingia sp. JS20170427COW]QCX52757.1 response regulator [Elizabethkingia sp. JS20170427COW]
MKRILIADDEHKILMTLEYAFRKAGYEVFVARDGTEVLEILQSQLPDILLLDIMMPTMDGFTTLSHLKAHEEYQNIKTIILSAKTRESDIQKGLGLGADAYFTKPYSIKKLLEKVNELLM